MVPEDPAAVAAREAKRKKTERTMVIVIGTGLAIGAAAAVRNLARDMREATALARRPKQPWDV